MNEIEPTILTAEQQTKIDSIAEIANQVNKKFPAYINQALFDVVFMAIVAVMYPRDDETE